MLALSDIKVYANLPTAVPDGLLTKHLKTAEGDLKRRTGLDTALIKHQAEWDEALTVKTLAAAYPWLNTFSLDGAAKVGRLEGTVEARFLDADETAERVELLNKRYEELVAVINPPSAGIAMVAV